MRKEEILNHAISSPKSCLSSELSHCHVPALGCENQQGVRVGISSIYKLRTFRRDTLLWINLLNKVSVLLTR
ncbi:hypothetical protein GUJ93_ZPchr0010g10007 [Zizania palustris]|uniref:Uncharacterized protein n=1 Tax=Zizania palustris TaxID=103762 RepID=A0A8J5WG34_ZIZPA|nr:hypothetical protein GUJ93_ZPchr0010g10007 [Zizania palustris]